MAKRRTRPTYAQQVEKKGKSLEERTQRQKAGLPPKTRKKK